MRAPSNRVCWRLRAAAVAVGTVAAALLVATPATANTNFNRSCELTEACLYSGAAGSGWIWDFEGTDTNLSNNWYPGGGPLVDNSADLIWGRGGSCVANWGPNYGGQGSQPWWYSQGPNHPGPPFTVWPGDQNTISSQWWTC